MYEFVLVIEAESGAELERIERISPAGRPVAGEILQLRDGRRYRVERTVFHDEDESRTRRVYMHAEVHVRRGSEPHSPRDLQPDEERPPRLDLLREMLPPLHATQQTTAASTG
jgi:hypothetical protein